MSKPKLKLILDDLSVDSFDTATGGPKGEGTVFGRARTDYPCNSMEQCPSYDAACGTGNSCATNCLVTYDTDCFTNNGTCTEPTCRGTISCQQTVWPVTCAC